MGGNYPRTENRDFIRRPDIMDLERRLDNIGKVVLREGVFHCRTYSYAVRMTDLLNKDLAMGANGRYVNVGNDIYYVPDPAHTHSHHGFELVEYRLESEKRSLFLPRSQVSLRTDDAVVLRDGSRFDPLTVDLPQLRYDGDNPRLDIGRDLLIRNDPRVFMPNYIRFAETFAEDVADRDEHSRKRVLAERYLSYVDNHKRMVRAEEISGREFDLTHLHNHREGVRTAGVFEDEGVVGVFSRVRELGIEKKYLSKFIFIDTQHDPRFQDVETSRLLRSAFREDGSEGGSFYKGIYRRPDAHVDGHVLLPVSAIEGSYGMRKGVVLHEIHHAHIQQKFEDKMISLFTDKNLTSDDRDQRSMAITGFHEFAAEMMSYNHLGPQDDYKEYLFARYGIDSKNPHNLKSFVRNARLEYDGGFRHQFVAWTHAFTRVADPMVHDRLTRALHQQNISESSRQNILNLSNVYSKCYNDGNWTIDPLLDHVRHT